jgi:hypothetical protein
MSRPNMLKALRRLEAELAAVVGAAPQTFGPEASRALEEKAADAVQIALASVATLWDVRWEREKGVPHAAND